MRRSTALAGGQETRLSNVATRVHYIPSHAPWVETHGYHGCRYATAAGTIEARSSLERFVVTVRVPLFAVETRLPFNRTGHDCKQCELRQGPLPEACRIGLPHGLERW